MLGWSIALTVMVAQLVMLFIFVLSSDNTDLSNDNSDLVYTFKCPPDEDVCRNTLGMFPNYIFTSLYRKAPDIFFVKDRNLLGWIAFGILMVAHLSKDSEFIALASFAPKLTN